MAPVPRQPDPQMDVPAYKAALTRVCVASRELPVDVRAHPWLCRIEVIADFCRFGTSWLITCMRERAWACWIAAGSRSKEREDCNGPRRCRKMVGGAAFARDGPCHTQDGCSSSRQSGAPLWSGNGFAVKSRRGKARRSAPRSDLRAASVPDPVPAV